MIEYETAKQLGVGSARAYLEATFPDGIALDTVFVGPELLHQLDASAEEAIATASWYDAPSRSPGSPAALY